ncbi:hypothetical protein CFB3_38190 [Clostridium folliculivorans]|uniref:Uncharacterized protein n=1 Tax=Clostridium folliculivorans TaxID=2886038 RepID=A0A9W5Y5U8_9CLOT|nr:hypothetical protein CFOLD11_39220 [Clostridium folliculivorans]GKU31712.1 hypothetical protein CFB3_38190 [Clostridium folliculivorans]
MYNFIIDFIFSNSLLRNQQSFENSLMIEVMTKKIDVLTSIFFSVNEGIGLNLVSAGFYNTLGIQ